MSFDPCSFLYDAATTRNAETFEHSIAGRPVIIVQSMAGAGYVLRSNSENYHKELWPFRQVMGATRLTESSADWRRMEAVTQSYLAGFDADRLAAAANEHASDLADRLLQTEDRGRLDQFAIDIATIRVLAETLLDGRLSDQAGEFAADMHVMLDYAASYAFIARDSRPDIDRDTIRNLAKARHRMMTRLSAVRSDLPAGDNLLTALDGADRSGDAGVMFQHELMMLFAAGSDTSAAAVGWCCQGLAENQAVQSAIRQELSGLERRQLCDPSVLNRLPWLNGFIEETLRLFPPIPFLGRQAQSADTINGHPVQRDQLVFVSIVGIHRDAGSWLNADQFSAERHGIAGSRAARAIPFSTGPRICGGARFAMLELKAVMATLISKLRFEPSGLDPGPFQWRISMRRRLDHPVTVKPAR